MPNITLQAYKILKYEHALTYQIKQNKMEHKITWGL